MPEMTIADEVSSLAGSHQAFRTWLSELDPVDPALPSRLPGWTVGHVLTHVARNADSQLSLVAGAAQYSGGRVQRDTDIEAGAGRSWAELIDDVVSASAAVDAAFDAIDDWSGTVDVGDATRLTTLLPRLRQREVEIHRFDLGLGYRFDEMPVDYVRRELVVMEMAWRARNPMGLTGLPADVLAASPSHRLAWFTGRASIDGVEPAGLF